MRQIVMMAMCLVLATAFGCGDDDDGDGPGGTSVEPASTGGFIGGSSSSGGSATTSQTTGQTWTASGVTGRGDLSAQGVPLMGNQPREDWCGAAERCTGADYVALYGEGEEVEDACGCVTSLRFCPGNAFDFASTDDPLYVRCEQIVAAYPVP